MSGYQAFPPKQFVPIFDTLNYTYQDEGVSLGYIMKYYLPLSGGTILGNLFINGILSLQSSSLVIGSTTVTSSGTQLNYLSGVISPGTAYASNALVLDSSLNISGINNITLTGSFSSPIINSSQYLISGVPVNLSSITGVTNGTATANKALIVDTNLAISGLGVISQTINAGGDMHLLNFTSSSGRATIKLISDISSAEFGIRGSTAGSFPNSYYMYSNGSYKWIMSMSNGDTQILSSTDSSNISTGALIVNGGVSIVKNITTTGILTLNRNGSNISIINGSNTALIELPASPNILRAVRGFSVNIGTNGVTIENASTRDPRYAIDLGNSAADIKIALFDGGGGVYGIGANNSRVQYISGGQNGHSFYKTTNNTIGTLQAEMNIDNNFICTNNVISNTGLHAYGFNNAGLSNYGMGLHFHYAASKGQIFTYNYSNSTYGQMSFQNDYLCITSQGNVNIGGASPTANLTPLYIQTALNYNVTGGYGYLSSGGSGTGSSTGSVGFSLFCAARIACSEIDCFSDRKFKSNIKDLDLTDCYDFMRVKSKSYNFKNETDLSIGFIAQDILHYNKGDVIANIVTISPDEEAEEYYDEETDIISPKGLSMSVKYNNVAVIHHEIIKDLIKKIDKNKEEIESHEKRLKENEFLINSLVKNVEQLMQMTSYFIPNHLQNLEKDIKKNKKIIEKLNETSDLKKLLNSLTTIENDN
jgi:hypothetical protein